MFYKIIFVVIVWHVKDEIRRIVNGNRLHLKFTKSQRLFHEFLCQDADVFACILISYAFVCLKKRPTRYAYDLYAKSTFCLLHKEQKLPLLIITV